MYTILRLLLAISYGLYWPLRKFILFVMTIILPVAFIEVASIFFIIGLAEYDAPIISAGTLIGIPIYICALLWALAITWCFRYFRFRYIAFYETVLDRPGQTRLTAQ